MPCSVLELQVRGEGRKEARKEACGSLVWTLLFSPGAMSRFCEGVRVRDAWHLVLLAVQLRGMASFQT